MWEAISRLAEKPWLCFERAQDWHDGSAHHKKIDNDTRPVLEKSQPKKIEQEVIQSHSTWNLDYSARSNRILATAAFLHERNLRVFPLLSKQLGAPVTARRFHQAFEFESSNSASVHGYVARAS